MKRLLHALAHFFHLQRGEAVAWWEGPVLTVGFRCSTCGAMSHVHARPRSGREIGS